MQSLSDLRKKQVVSSDGHILGHIVDAILERKWCLCRFTVKMESGVLKTLHRKKPVISSMLLDMPVTMIRGIGEKVVLSQPLNNLGQYFQDHHGSDIASRVFEKDVMDTKGVRMGVVEDLLIEEGKWDIPYLQVVVNKEVIEKMGINKPFMRLPRVNLPMAYVDYVGDVVMLNTDVVNMGKIIQRKEAKQKPQKGQKPAQQQPPQQQPPQKGQQPPPQQPPQHGQHQPPPQ